MAVTALERALSRVCPVELPQAHAYATTLLPEPPHQDDPGAPRVTLHRRFLVGLGNPGCAQVGLGRNF
jgi:hypothetical protein